MQTIRCTRRSAAIPGLVGGAVLALASVARADSVQLAIDHVLVREPYSGTLVAEVPVRRYGDLRPSLALRYSTHSPRPWGTSYRAWDPALEGADYLPETGAYVVLDSGASRAILPVTILSDREKEIDELFSVSLDGAEPVGPAPEFSAAFELHGVDTYGGDSWNYVAAGDLDGDGRPDLVAVGEGTESVSVLVNATTPESDAVVFGPPVLGGMAQSPACVAVVDVNRDGRLDLVTGDWNSVGVFLNTTKDGGGLSFAERVDFSVSLPPADIRALDLNSDGRPDLAMVSRQGHSVAFLLNQTGPGADAPAFGGEWFTRLDPDPAGSYVQSMAVADFDGDGRTDIVVGDKARGLSLLLNQTESGSGTLQFAQASVGEPWAPSDTLATADFNRDGRPDLIASNGEEVVVSMNLTPYGTSTLAFASGVALGSPASSSLAVADFNGDNKPDVAATGEAVHEVQVVAGITLRWATSTGFRDPVVLELSRRPSHMAVADFNGDGRPDIVTAEAASLAVFVNRTPRASYNDSEVARPTLPASVRIVDAQHVSGRGAGGAWSMFGVVLFLGARRLRIAA